MFFNKLNFRTNSIHKKLNPIHKRIFNPILCLFALIFLTQTPGCTNWNGEKKPIKISFTVRPGYAFAFIAQKKGFFRRNRVDVELLLQDSMTKSAELFKNRETDGYFGVFSDIVMMNAEGVKTKVVYLIDYSDTGDVIIGRPEFNSIADLKHKVVGFEGVNSFSHILVLKLLENAGITETDVFLSPKKTMNILPALEMGKIDAGHTRDPVTSQALQKGYKILGKAGDIPGLITDVLAFNKTIVETRPQEIQKIILSLIEAANFIETNMQEALDIMSESVGMSKKEMENGISGIYFYDLALNLSAMKDSHDLISLFNSGRTIAQFYMERGQLAKLPDMDDIIEPKFIKNIQERKRR